MPPDAVSVRSSPRHIDVLALTVSDCAKERLDPTSSNNTARILRIRFCVFISILFIAWLK